MSRLLEKLRRAVRGEPRQPIGFGRPPADSTRVPPLVLVARLADRDPDLVSRLRSAGVDTLLLPAGPGPLEGPETEALAGLTWGVSLSGSPSADLVDGYLRAGADFVVVEGSGPASLLGEDGGRYLALTPDFPDGLLRSLDLLPVEGFWLRPGPVGDPLTVLDMLVFLKFAAATRKPVLYELGRLPSAAELPALRDVGVVGLAVPATAANIETLVRLREDLAGLPRRRVPSSERPVVTVPPPPGPAPGPDEDDEE